MAINLGADAISAMFVGADSITKAYLGADQVFTDTGGGGGGDNTEDEEMTLLASGTFSSPVTHLDLALTAGYSAFKLKLVDLVPDIGGSSFAAVAGGFSIDGTSFPDDGDNLDTYLTLITTWNEPVDYNPAAQANDQAQIDRVISMIGPYSDGSPIGLTAQFEISPGSATKYPTVIGKAIRAKPIGGGAVLNMCADDIFATFNPSATTPAALGRNTVLRILPYDDGVLNTPSANGTFTAGRYFFYGTPDPA